MIDLNINTDLARLILTGFIRSEIGRVGFSRAVIGLSGGIDSALSFALAVEALGAENVLAVRMPYRASSADSLEHAEMLIEQYQTPSKTVEITNMVEPLFAQDPEITKQRKGNIMARQRMIVLYDQSEVFKGLVVGTSNKTEILLGYSTQFGDAASALNPLGDLYKQQVWQLARHLGVPETVVAKQPSADLWPGQTDEGDFGFDYRTADEVLYLMFDLGLTAEEIVERGYAAGTVQSIVRLERLNRFKRRMMLIARLSGSAVNLDREIPRD